MQKLFNCLAATFCICFFTAASAQTDTIRVNTPDYKKPSLFADLPAKMELDQADLQSYFGIKSQQKLQMRLSQEFSFQGAVISSKKNASQQSIVIKSENRPGATFTLSMITDKEGAVKFVGRIINLNSVDALELTHEDGRYFLVKRNLYDLINE